MTPTARFLPLALLVGCIFGGGNDEPTIGSEPETLDSGLVTIDPGERPTRGDSEVPFQPSTECPAAETPLACQVIELVNQERAGRNLPPLDYDYHLAVAAYRHAEDMAVNGYFDHVSQDGRRFDERIIDAGYDAFPRAENIAYGYPTAEAVMVGWMNSEGHRANILDTVGNEIGVGHYPSVNMWVQNFGSR